jgi:hypothetical protein
MRGNSIPLALRKLMNTAYPDRPWVDPNFRENQRRFPEDQLLQYAGQHVAWSWDGTQILAADSDRGVLSEKLRGAGIDLGRVVFGYIDALDVTSNFDCVAFTD